jgi:outer membrane protein TolC
MLFEGPFMRLCQRLSVLFCVCALTASAQSATPLEVPNVLEPEGGFFKRLTRPYRTVEQPPISTANSGRIDSLLRAGRLYLSLQDAIALALENNLDIAIQRYGPMIAEADIQRARAGGLLRGIPQSVRQGPQSAGGQRGQDTGITTSAAQQAGGGGDSGGTIITSTGSAIPNLDPVITGFLRWAHNTNPQTSSFVSGTNTLVTRNDLHNLSYQQGFLTGTTVSLGLSNSHVSSTSLRSELNPSTSGSLSLNITQKLLQGFGPAVNSRLIRIAKNNREVSDLVFKQQVIVTVSAIANLYWDLVSMNEEVKVRRQALTTSERLHQDNQKQVEIGTLAPIEIVRAEAEVASRQQDLTVAETQLLQQETILKNALSRTGTVSPAVSDARVVPTDRIRMPDTEPIEPIQDMVAQAMSARPELAQRRIQIENAKINLKGSKSQLLPTVDAFINLQNNALAGSMNVLPLPEGQQFITRNPPNAFFIGGYGTVLSQIFARNFPDYNAGFQLNIPLRNRAAQADVTRDQLSLRQQELGLRQLENQVRVDVQNALIALQQARARYRAANKARVLQEQTLDAEQKKYALGASTIYNVILVQRDLAQAQSGEVAALSAYSIARTDLDRATGLTLATHNISLEEAYRGTVSRPPDPLPVLDAPNGKN